MTNCWPRATTCPMLGASRTVGRSFASILMRAASQHGRVGLAPVLGQEIGIDGRAVGLDDRRVALLAPPRSGERPPAVLVSLTPFRFSGSLRMAVIRALRCFSGSFLRPGPQAALAACRQEVRDVLLVRLLDGHDDVAVGGDPAIRVDDEAGPVLRVRVRLHDIGVVRPAPDGDLGRHLDDDPDHAREHPHDPSRHDLLLAVGPDLAGESEDGRQQEKPGGEQPPGDKRDIALLQRLRRHPGVCAKRHSSALESMSSSFSAPVPAS